MKHYLPEGITRSERTGILNDDMRSSVPGICLERARLITESYEKTEGEPYLIRRAKGLAHILRNMTVFIRPEELIVGNHASKQRYAPLFPETGPFSARELDLMPVREVDTLMITDQQKKELLEDIYPRWKGKTLEDIASSRFPDELKSVLNSPNPVFDCFSRARSGYGHYLPDIERIMHTGFISIEKVAQEKLRLLSLSECTEGRPDQAFIHDESWSSEGGSCSGTGTCNTATPQGKRAF